MAQDELGAYKKFVQKRLDALTPIFAKASIGDFSQDVVIPEKEDEFTEFLVGVQIMLEVIREKGEEYKELVRKLERTVYERTEKLLESEEKLRTIIEYSTNLFYSQTRNHLLTFVSPQSRDYLGVGPEEAKVKWTKFVSNHPLNKRGFELTEKAIQTGKRQPPYELEILQKSGRKIWVEVREAPVVVKGKTVAIVGSLTDITKRKEAEKQLKKYAGELERLNKFMVGRELKMVELKKRVSRLEAEVSKNKKNRRETK